MFSLSVWAFPIAVCLHIAEEWPRFPRWARRHASPAYSNREYIVTHTVAVVTSVLTAGLVSRYPSPWLMFAFFALAFGPGALWNACFHVGASLRSRSYCPGVVTGLVVYLPLAGTLAVAALRSGWLSRRALVAALVVAAVVHTVEVGHNVFKRW